MSNRSFAYIFIIYTGRQERRRGTFVKVSARAIFSGALLRRIVFLWIGFAFLTVSFHFANTWTPKLIANATGNAGLGVRAGVLIAVGGVLGALAFAALSPTRVAFGHDGGPDTARWPNRLLTGQTHAG